MALPKLEAELLRVLKGLSPSAQAEVLDFARYLQQRTSGGDSAQAEGPAVELRAAPADTLRSLTGLVAVGGDAIAESESLYDDNGHH